MSSSSEGYVYACQRAELLGVPAPTEEEWTESEKARLREEVEQEAHDDTVAQNLEDTGEGLSRVGGGLDEINSILSATQKKINRFKTVCGSLGTLLKVRVSSRPGTPEHKAKKGTIETSEPLETAPESADNSDNVSQHPPGSVPGKKATMDTKMGSQIDKLDSLINMADNAQYRMKNQTNQMKKFLK